MDEARLVENLRLIEALYSGATTEGEKVAAHRARQRILERLRLLEREDPPVEYRFSMSDMWSRKVFVALLRRYEIRPYRYGGQRRTTVMANVSKRFVDETLWPEFQEIGKSLHAYLSDVTDRVISQVIHQDNSEAEVIDEPKRITLGTGDRDPVAASSPADGPTTGQPPTEQTSDTDSTRRAERNRKKAERKRNKRKRRRRG